MLAYQDVGELLVVEEDALVLEAQLFHEVDGLLPRLAMVEEVDRLEVQTLLCTKTNNTTAGSVYGLDRVSTDSLESSGCTLRSHAISLFWWGPMGGTVSSVQSYSSACSRSVRPASTK